MDVFAQPPAPPRNDLKRYAVEPAPIPNRSSTRVSRQGNLTSGFAKVAAQASTDLRRDSNVAPEIKTEKPAKTLPLWENPQVGFEDFVDIINPLQHIPIVATIYRNKTGDGIGLAARVVGGALWGRIGGFVSGVVNGVVHWFTGKDIGDHIYAALFGPSGESKREGVVAKSVESPHGHALIQSIASQTRFETSQSTESAFGDFDDDGGFSPPVRRAARLRELVALRSTSFAPNSLVAINSYEQNIEPEESEQRFRFRFPA
jgi:hypothetical protein